MNRDEMMLNTILQNGELPDDFQPQSRFEAIAKSIINKEDYTEKPQSRHEELFLAIGEMIKEGGGGKGDQSLAISLIERNAVNVEIPEGTKKISTYVFSIFDPNEETGWTGLATLESVKIPSSVETIEPSAFRNCSNLNNISFDNRNGKPLLLKTYAFSNIKIGPILNVSKDWIYKETIDGYEYKYIEQFSNNSHINEVIFENGCVEIPNAFLSHCSSLRTVQMPSSITDIADNAFYYCNNLENVNLPSSITRINNGLFQYCSSLTSISIPENVTYIGGSVFYSCTGLESIYIPENVTYIGGSAFYNCSNLKNIKLPKNLTSLLTNTFVRCGITSIDLTNIINIGTGAFSNCEYLESITFGNNLASLGQRCFENCKSLTEIVIPYVINSVGMGFINNCSSLTYLEIGFNTGSSSLINSASLQKIKFVEGTTNLGYSSLITGTSIQTIDIPSTVTNMNGMYMFSRLSSLKDLVIRAVTPPTLHANAFSGGYYPTNIYVPDESVEIYKTATNWSNTNIKSKIKPLSQYVEV